MMKKMENFGSPKILHPLLYRLAIRLDGSALYQSIAALFVAQMYGMHLTLSEQIVLMH